MGRIEDARATTSRRDIAETVALLLTYDHGHKTTALLAVERLINETAGNRDLRAQIERELVKVLQSDASVACKQFVCQKLSIMGANTSVPVLAKMLLDSDTHLAEAACYALCRNPSPSVGAALRNALDRAKGNGLVAVINLLGDRRDRESAVRIAELAAGGDDTVADAAIAALGKIATPGAIRTLSALHKNGASARSVAAAHALLQSSQELAARGDTAAAKEVYGQVTASSVQIPRSRFRASHPLPEPLARAKVHRRCETEAR